MAKLVLVEWVDSYGCSPSWVSIPKDMDPQIMRCESVGWLLYEGAESIVVAPHRAYSDGNGQACGDMTIPVCAIQTITTLACPGYDRGDHYRAPDYVGSLEPSTPSPTPTPPPDA